MSLCEALGPFGMSGDHRDLGQGERLSHGRTERFGQGLTGLITCPRFVPVTTTEQRRSETALGPKMTQRTLTRRVDKQDSKCKTLAQQDSNTEH